MNGQNELTNYFHKACTLCHTCALWTYNTYSLHHHYNYTQFTLHVINAIKLVPCALLRLFSTWEFLRTLKKCKKHLPAACASLACLLRS